MRLYRDGAGDEDTNSNCFSAISATDVCHGLLTDEVCGEVAAEGRFPTFPHALGIQFLFGRRRFVGLLLVLGDRDAQVAAVAGGSPLRGITEFAPPMPAVSDLWSLRRPGHGAFPDRFAQRVPRSARLEVDAHGAVDRPWCVVYSSSSTPVGPGLPVRSPH